MRSARPSRRWLRTVSWALPIIAVGVVVFGIVASGGGAPHSPRHGTHGLASLLNPDGRAGAHRSHRATVRARPFRHSRHHRGSQGGRAAYRIATPHDIALAPTSQVIAHLRHGTKGYPGPNAVRPNRFVPGSWYGHRSVLPVLAETPDRLRVRLAQRPNGATTWIKRDKAVLTITHWAVVVDLTRHHLYVFRDGVQRHAFPVGTGAYGTPTPTGLFFVAFHTPSNGPGYGPIDLATSAHSTVFRTFEGGDDAIIAIHGPIGSDALIGNHGAAISNGCIRMHLGDLAKAVRHVPDGAPVVVTY